MKNLGLGKFGSNQIIKKKFLLTFSLIERVKSEAGHEIEVHHDPFFIKTKQCSFDSQELDFLNNNHVDLSFIKDEELRKKLEKQILAFSLTADDGTVQTFYRCLSEFYDLDGSIELKKEPLWRNWGGIFTILSGCGVPLERWTMRSILPLSINFGDYSYDSIEDSFMEVILTYDDVKYDSYSVLNPPC